jgi:hypothetical protein
VILVHLYSCRDPFVEDLIEYLKMTSKVEKYCFYGHCCIESHLLFNPKPNDGNVLLVFISEFLSPRFSDLDWKSDFDSFSCLLRIRPDLRRVILIPKALDCKYGRERENTEKFNSKLEKWCAENATNFRFLCPDSLPINDEDGWNYEWSQVPEHVIEKLGQVILALATSTEAKFENHVDSSKRDKVRTSTLVNIIFT